jgi:hypothetical protein
MSNTWRRCLSCAGRAAWSPDGRRIAIAAADAAGSTITIIDVGD